MKRKRRETVAIICLIAALVAVAIAALFSSNAFPIVAESTCPPEAGDHIAMAFWCRVYSWQSMITGAFALIAAWTAWKSVERQIRAEERRQKAIKIEMLKATQAHLGQLQKWCLGIKNNLDAIINYNAPSKDDDSIDTIIGNALWGDLPVTEPVKDHLSVDTHMEMQLANLMMSNFRNSMEELRIDCEGKIKLYDVAGEELDAIQKDASNMKSRYIKLESCLRHDCTRVGWFLEKAEAPV